MKPEEFDLNRPMSGEKQKVRRKQKKKDGADGKEPLKKRRKGFNTGGGLMLTSPQKEEVPEISIDSIMAALRPLPNLTLQEPEVVTNHLIHPVIGQPATNGM